MVENRKPEIQIVTSKFSYEPVFILQIWRRSWKLFPSKVGVLSIEDLNIFLRKAWDFWIKDLPSNNPHHQNILFSMWEDILCLQSFAYKNRNITLFNTEAISHNRPKKKIAKNSQRRHKIYFNIRNGCLLLEDSKLNLLEIERFFERRRTIFSKKTGRASKGHARFSHRRQHNLLKEHQKYFSQKTRRAKKTDLLSGILEGRMIENEVLAAGDVKVLSQKSRRSSHKRRKSLLTKDTTVFSQKT